MNTNKTRLEANREILNRLCAAVEAHPEQRFMQLLQNMNVTIRNGFEIVDQFYEESTETLGRIAQKTGEL